MIKRLLGVAAAGLILGGIALLLFQSRVSVPAGTVVVVGDPPRVLAPGGHWARPFLPRTRYAAGVRRVEFDSRALDEFRLFAQDTTEVEAALWAEVDLSVPALVALAGRVPEAAIEETLRGVLRRFVGRTPPAELVGVGDRAADRRGLRRALADALPRTPGWAWTLGDPRFERAAAGLEREARRRAAAVGRRVLLVGVDSADWDLLRPMLDRGELPRFQSLIDRGASGPLESIVPLLSPLIWTTLATGVSPERHGVLDFVSRAPDGSVVPVGTADRRVPAIWNYTGDWGKRVSVVSWLATYPAEPVSGTLVSDRFGFLAYVHAAESGTEGMTWPPELASEAEPYRVSPEDLPLDMLDRFVDVPAESLQAGRAPGFRKGRLINNMIHTLAAAETTRRLSLALWKRDAPDLGLFYFEMVDAMGHLFMPFAPPRLSWVSAEDQKAYGDAIAQSYRYQDEILGDFLDAADESTLVVVVSDHGFKSKGARPRAGSQIGEAGAAHWHTLNGVIILAGPGVRRGATIPDATVYDVAPTLLAYLGIPPPGDMEGRVLREAFTLDLPRAASSSPDPGTPDTVTDPGPSGGSEATTWNNLGLRQLGSGEPEAAIESFLKALAADPKLVTARNNLGIAYLELHRFEEARVLLEQTVADRPDYSSGWLNLGLCYLSLGRKPDALDALSRAESLDPENPRILRNLGFAYLENGDPSRAREVFEASLAVEETAGGRFGLGAAWLQLGDRRRGQTELQRALDLDPGHEQARRALESLPASR